jgi:methylated-DNA-[protein]-cysteine S-methyltransferase
MTRYRRIDTDFGALFATLADAGIGAIHFIGGRHAPPIAREWIEDAQSPLLDACEAQLREYIGGRRRAFDLALAPRGTAFQERVWSEIARIGFGETITYGELARRCGRPEAIRAAAAATGRNPLSIVVPCHRIVGADGSLTGYAGGIDRKARLLALEAA